MISVDKFGPADDFIIRRSRARAATVCASESHECPTQTYLHILPNGIINNK